MSFAAIRARTIVLAALALSVLLPPSTAPASTGPTTPTFVLAWGNYGADPGQFQFPPGVATDALGDVYVADRSNHRIQKFDRLGNLIVMWGSFGTGNGQFSDPMGIAVDAAGNVYVADTGNGRIQKFTATGTYLTQWGSPGTGNGQFTSPTGVAVDAAVNVYVAEYGGHRIQKFTATGAYLTQWGSIGIGDGQFYGPFAVGTDGAGNVYVVDTNNSRIQKFTAAGVYLTQWGSLGTGDGQLNRPAGVAADAVGNIYVTDNDNHRIQKFTATGGFLANWGSVGSGNGQFINPEGIAVDAAGNVYIADFNNNRIQKFSSAGAALSEPPAAFLLKWGSFAYGSGNGEFSVPYGVATDAAGNVYVADYNNYRIQKFSNAGTYLTQWGTPGIGNGQFNLPIGVATDAAGNVYVADHNNHRLQKFSNAGTYLTQWGTPGSGNGQFSYPDGVATDAAGNVYVADAGNHRIQKFSGTGTYLTQWGTFGSGNGQFFNPTGVATDAAGNLYVADFNNHRIQKFSSAGTYLTQWGTPGSGNGQFNLPEGVATDAAGNVYVADRLNQRIQKFSSAGTYLTQWGMFGSGNGQFSIPSGVATDAAGNVYVADLGNNHIHKFVTPAAIALVSDIRNDQGRQVRLRILRASADSPGSGATVLRYDVFRRIDPLPGAASAAPVATTVGMTGTLGARTSAPNGIQLAGWDQVGSISAYGESEYNVVVPTLINATAASLEYSAFMVRAATSDPFTFFDSGADNGFSMDNLSPPAPSPFTGAYLAGATHLHWGVSPAGDFATFRLYRGSSPDFIPGPGNFVTATPDTGYADIGAAGSYYKLSAVDLNGNESPFALLGPGQTTDTPLDRPFTLTLEGSRPNPARGGRLRIHFALPSDAPARLELFDLAGRSMASRDVGALGPGRHAEDLAAGRALPPGIYLVRLTQGASRRLVRVALLD